MCINEIVYILKENAYTTINSQLNRVVEISMYGNTHQDVRRVAIILFTDLIDTNFKFIEDNYINIMQVIINAMEFSISPNDIYVSLINKLLIKITLFLIYLGR